MTHDIHLSFDNLALQNTGLQVKRGDYETHTLNFIFDDVGADNYRIRIKNANGECAESDILDAPLYTLGAFDVSCVGVVNAELSAYNGDTRITSATFTYEVLGDISADKDVVCDDRFPILDSLVKKTEEFLKGFPKAKDIATLTDGKLTPSQIPSISINDVFTVSSAEEMTALDAQRGDVAIFTYDSGSVSTERPESMLKNTILIDQSIDGTETVESLREEGISFSVKPTSISNSLNKNYWGDYKDGVYWTGSTSPRTTYTNMLSGDYTISVSTKIDVNKIRYYINYIDSNNYYLLTLDYNGKLVATKKLNGITYTLDAVGNAGTVDFHSRVCNSEIKVELESGGGIKISLISDDNVTSHAKCSYEIIDDGKLYGETIKEGMFVVSPSYAFETSFYSLKIVKHEQYGSTIATRLRDTYILSSNDPTNLDSWVKIGISYVEYSGISAYAENAKNANAINGHKIVEMSEAEFENAVKDPNTYYLVY